jgi:hypothetical protein
MSQVLHFRMGWPRRQEMYCHLKIYNLKTPLFIMQCLRLAPASKGGLMTLLLLLSVLPFSIQDEIG